MTADRGWPGDLREALRPGAVRVVLGICLLSLPPFAPAASADAARPAEPELRGQRGDSIAATIRRTEYGVPHIKSPSFEGVGFGFGRAFAEDNVCTMADSYITVAGERSRHFGPNGSWRFEGNSAVSNNLLSDIFYTKINESGVVEALVASKPPHGPLPRVKKLIRGYVAGYNAYLRSRGVERIPDRRCRGEDWVRPIEEIDVYRRFFQLGSLASSGVAIEGIAGAAPATGARAEEAEAEQRDLLEGAESGSLSRLNVPAGSNAYGFGADATRTGRGMVLGNPHFPWNGAERLYQTHFTVPGKLDAAGATLYGVPLVLIGHNRHLAWAHTVATAWRFVPYELRLVPGDPYSYYVDGVPKPMKRTRVTVKARTADGALEDRTGTIYETDYGPVLTSILDIPLFPWTAERAYALADVNAANFRYLNHFLRSNLIRSVGRYDRLQRRLQGIPWVASIAADRKGNAYYSTDGAIPNVPDWKARSCSGEIGAVTFEVAGLPVLDGSRSACALGTDAGAAAPGILGPSRIPRLFRRDYVHNGNDSHWIPNPRQPLEGFDRIIGDERTERSLRTRLGLLMAEELLARAHRLRRQGLTLGKLQRIVLNNRHYGGELWRDELVALCRSRPLQSGRNGPVDVSEACPVLEGWNLRDDLGSNGAILFRRFAANLFANGRSIPTGSASSQNPAVSAAFERPFDPADPVNTPDGLNEQNPAVGTALADAVEDLREARIPLDAPLRGWQYDVRGGKRIPMHGGPGTFGVFNAVNARWNRREGYSSVPHGTSFLTAIAFTGRRCPVRARTFVAYGQSENQRSPHAADYPRAFSRKDWNAAPFCANQVRRKTREIQRVRGRLGR